ncbi:uncharacterized protein LAESUDRAFT_764032 [Laetiporus sulphureus 93-53]|uniref:Uncharacterized protein n=1 Tax=Laetiporus sulphureus 93-53 TaxID=1314785 RepID=A0A165BI82_9APHY|nr:uncharacterized protein LAESUDRAFT_764032 [Laetiporus sulphureus 93-53]KZT01106.1 hypothetical protein LAESUDRAFT_764032 [Laetiporus sulphureus 93-53]
MRIIMLRPFISRIVRSLPLDWRNALVDWMPIPALQFHSPFRGVKRIAPGRNRRLSMFNLVPSPATYDEEYATVQLCGANNSDSEEQDCRPSPRMPSKSLRKH